MVGTAGVYNQYRRCSDGRERMCMEVVKLCSRMGNVFQLLLRVPDRDCGVKFTGG